MVKITIEGNPDEVARTLRRLGRQAFVDEPQDGEQEVEQVSSVPGDRMDDKPSLSPEEVTQLLSQITPEARRILEEIARHPDSYTFQDLQRTLNLSGTEIAGRLSSVGHKMRHFRGKAGPVTRDYTQREYRMQPELAEVIRRQAHG